MYAFRYKEMKIHSHDAVHMTKMAARPINIWYKHLKILPSRNQRADFDKTWYEASETQAHYILFK